MQSSFRCADFVVSAVSCRLVVVQSFCRSVDVRRVVCGSVDFRLVVQLAGRRGRVLPVGRRRSCAAVLLPPLVRVCLCVCMYACVLDDDVGTVGLSPSARPRASALGAARSSVGSRTANQPNLRHGLWLYKHTHIHTYTLHRLIAMLT